MARDNPYKPRSKNPMKAASLVIAAILSLIFIAFAFFKELSLGPSIMGTAIIAMVSYLVFSRILTRRIK